LALQDGNLIRNYAIAAARVLLDTVRPLRHLQSVSWWLEVLVTVGAVGIAAALGFITREWPAAVLAVAAFLLLLEAIKLQARLDNTARSPFDCNPEVRAEHYYGPKRDEKAFYVRLRVRTTDGTARLDVEGRLVSAQPTDPGFAAAVAPKDGGLLRWGATQAGAATRALVGPNGASLDVIAFENNDRRGAIVYEDVRFRDPDVLLEPCAWDFVVEINAPDGATAVCGFAVALGTEEFNSGVIRASREGMLYGPTVTRTFPVG
jgi:hypothetical protein